MCGISVILYTPCHQVASLGCRFHIDLKHTHTHARTFIFGQLKPGVGYLELFQRFPPKTQPKENILDATLRNLLGLHIFSISVSCHLFPARFVVGRGGCQCLCSGSLCIF